MSFQNQLIDSQADDEFEKETAHLLELALRRDGSEAILKPALEEALIITGGKRSFAAVIEQDSGEMIVAETAGEDWTDERRRIRLRPHNETERGITGYVALTGKPYFSPDVSKDPHYIPSFPDVRSEAAVPFFDAEGKVRGVLSVDSPHLDAFNASHLYRLATLANTIATAMAFAVG